MVYFNGTLEADWVNLTPYNSTYVQFACYNASGAAIDNLVVEDEPLPDPPTTPTTPTSTTTPTTTPPPLDPILIGLVGGIGVGVVILLVIVYRRRS